MNGLGERCGNANLCSLLPNLMLKEPYASQFETGVALENLTQLTHVSRLLDEILNRAPNRYAPYVGASAFTHKGGLHVSAVMKDPQTYEHVPPETVGNKRVMPVSDQSGRSNLVARSGGRRHRRRRQGRWRAPAAGRQAAANFRAMPMTVPRPRSSFWRCAQQGKLPRYFTVEQLQRHGGKRAATAAQMASRSRSRGGADRWRARSITNIGTGNGPVNALDAALRKDLGKYSPFLADLRLVDYKVRILTSGTEAVTRVMVESADGKGNRWSTVGVSANIVDASFEALTDSIIYKLYRDKAPA